MQSYMDKSQLGDPLQWLTTAKEYYFPSQTAPAPAPTPKGTSIRYYAEGGYAYLYDSATGAITIVLSPKGTNQISVAPGSAAYAAIATQIRNGQAKLVTPEQLKAMRAAAKSAPSTKAKTTQVSTYEAPAAALPEPTAAKTDYTAYAPYAILGAGILVAGGILLLGRRK